MILEDSTSTIAIDALRALAEVGVAQKFSPRALRAAFGTLPL